MTVAGIAHRAGTAGAALDATAADGARAASRAELEVLLVDAAIEPGGSGAPAPAATRRAASSRRLPLERDDERSGG
jgi:hypothetical protein